MFFVNTKELMLFISIFLLLSGLEFILKVITKNIPQTFVARNLSSTSASSSINLGPLQRDLRQIHAQIGSASHVTRKIPGENYTLVKQKKIDPSLIESGDIDGPSQYATDDQWISFLKKEYGLKPFFDRPKQLIKFSSPDFYGAIKANPFMQETFTKMIDYYEEGNRCNFSNSQLSHLRKLYELGFILPMKSKKAQNMSKVLNQGKNYLLKNGISENSMARFTDIYRICTGSQEETPSAQVIIKAFKSLDFKLPEVLIKDRSRKQDKEKTALEKYKRRVNRPSSRYVDLKKTRVNRGGRKTLEKVARYQVGDEQLLRVDKKISAGDPQRVRRTKTRQGVRAQIADEKDRKYGVYGIAEERVRDLGGVFGRETGRADDFVNPPKGFAGWESFMQATTLKSQYEKPVIVSDKDFGEKEGVVLSKLDDKLLLNSFKAELESQIGSQRHSVSKFDLLLRLIELSPSIKFTDKKAHYMDSNSTKGRWVLNEISKLQSGEARLSLKQRAFLEKAYELGFMKVMVPESAKSKINEQDSGQVIQRRVLKGGLERVL